MYRVATTRRVVQVFLCIEANSDYQTVTRKGLGVKLYVLSIIAATAILMAGCGHKAVLPVENPQSTSAPFESTPKKSFERRPSSQTTIPDQVVVNLKFKDAPLPYVLTDNDQSIVTGLMATLQSAMYSVPINDYLDLSHAAHREFISPSLNGCQLTAYSMDYVGPANEILMFGGRDLQGAQSCQDFMKSVASSGLQMKFNDVPLLNSRSKRIKTLIVNISNP